MSHDHIVTLLKDVLSTAGYSIDDIVVEPKDEREIYINILSEQDAVHLIGRGGEHLRALQSIVKNVLRNQDTENPLMVRLDVDSYRVQQEDHVRRMADQRAQRVLQSGGKVSLPPMSSFFRRLVHLYVKDNYPELDTFSHGGSRDRSVCIVLKSENPSSESDEQEVSTDIYAELEF